MKNRREFISKACPRRIADLERVSPPDLASLRELAGGPDLYDARRARKSADPA